MYDRLASLIIIKLVLFVPTHWLPSGPLHYYYFVYCCASKSIIHTVSCFLHFPMFFGLIILTVNTSMKNIAFYFSSQITPLIDILHFYMSTSGYQRRKNVSYCSFVSIYDVPQRLLVSYSVVIHDSRPLLYNLLDSTVSKQFIVVSEEPIRWNKVAADLVARYLQLSVPLYFPLELLWLGTSITVTLKRYFGNVLLVV